MAHPLQDENLPDSDDEDMQKSESRRTPAEAQLSHFWMLLVCNSLRMVLFKSLQEPINSPRSTMRVQFAKDMRDLAQTMLPNVVIESVDTHSPIPDSVKPFFLEDSPRARNSVNDALLPALVAQHHRDPLPLDLCKQPG